MALAAEAQTKRLSSRARPLRLQAAGEKPVEGIPAEAGQARRQVSLHEMWWGYRWSNGGTFQSACSRGHHLNRSPLGMQQERWEGRTDSGRREHFVQVCQRIWATVDTTQQECRGSIYCAHFPRGIVLTKLWQKDYRLNEQVERFEVAQNSQIDVRLIHHDVWGSLAHIAMLTKIGVLTESEHKVLVTAFQVATRDRSQLSRQQWRQCS
jgi:hypothetical protein